MLHIGIDLGGTNIAAGLVDEQGVILEKSSLPTDRERRYEAILDTIQTLSGTLFARAQAMGKRVDFVGVGTPGMTHRGELIYASTFPRFQNVPMARDLEKRLSVAVDIGNDANCAALGESVAGAAKGTKDSITVTLGTGIGGGVIANGRLLLGANGAAAEIGHMVIDMGGERCPCGRRGCFEAYASATALTAQIRQGASAHPESLLWTLCGGSAERMDPKLLFAAAEQMDQCALELVDRYADYLAEGVANLVNIFQPEVVLLSGGVSHAGEALLKPLRQKLLPLCYGSAYAPIPRVERAILGNDAGVVGAAFLQ